MMKLLQSKAVRELCGGISDMALWRWLNDPEMNFPKPLMLSRRRYWREDELIAWIAERADAREVQQ